MTRLVGHSEGQEATDRRARSDVRRALSLIRAKVPDNTTLTASSAPSAFPDGMSYVGNATSADGWPANGVAFVVKGDGGVAQTHYSMANVVKTRTQDGALDSWTAWA